MAGKAKRLRSCSYLKTEDACLPVCDTEGNRVIDEAVWRRFAEKVNERYIGVVKEIIRENPESSIIIRDGGAKNVRSPKGAGSP